MPLIAAMLLMTTFDIDPSYKPVKDPLAPARAGKIQCHEPDTEGHTCRIMTWFSEGADGRVQARQITALADKPSLAAELNIALTREGAGFCGVVNESYMAGFRIVSGSAPYAPADNKRYAILYREGLLATLWNRKTCSYAFARPGDDMQLEVGTVDGEFAGELMASYIWIDPGAGWRLKARPQV
ncbi:hypothetical protein L7H23_12885 [Sphingopyxis sp. BSN-002]|uniref:hypothetical protein n=1 Tax=Sphingopyxis sp. BSN-002 TaxID=2911495 RepID=UPI001EDB8119|nr:hypothetical protein [Sphingopyxis sp. BSN-002]UKK83454.1 hypothetical protein L7H23_12885 [Sphingopyxis sp. BSN-002]